MKQPQSIDLRLLREVLETRAPDDVVGYETKAADGTLTRAERARVCELLALELAATGFDADYEPTRRGMQLEELIDIINRSNIKGGE